MAKNFYSDYVAHITRFYLGHDVNRSAFRSAVDAENYQAVDKVVGTLTEDDMRIISEFYTQNGPRERKAGVYREAITDRHTHEVIAAYERAVARERSLIA